VPGAKRANLRTTRHFAESIRGDRNACPAPGHRFKPQATLAICRQDGNRTWCVDAIVAVSAIGHVMMACSTAFQGCHNEMAGGKDRTFDELCIISTGHVELSVRPDKGAVLSGPRTEVL